LRWFRRKKDDEQAPTEAAAPAPDDPVTVEAPLAEEGATTDPKTKRRRGTRGGRGRKKPVAEAKPAAEKPAPAAAKKKQPERKPERAPRPLPRPGLAGGTAEMRGLDLPEKPDV
jgi:hypothetical protein